MKCADSPLRNWVVCLCVCVQAYMHMCVYMRMHTCVHAKSLIIIVVVTLLDSEAAFIENSLCLLASCFWHFSLAPPFSWQKA